jgi:endo-1,4-beta-xylanase
VLRDDGSLDFSGADKLVAFAQAERLRVHGHNLIWYIYRPPAFLRLAGDKAAFARAYDNYIHAVAGRHRGRIAGWDVVNEPVTEEGEGYRNSLWSEQLGGVDHIVRALDAAREADPQAVLFVNEYHLESKPKKLATFLRLIEDLLRRGAPLTGIGTQMHMQYEQDPATIAPMIRELAAFGLPIHVSELDVSTRGGRQDFRPPEVRLERQARLVAEAAAAFAALPDRQRYAFTTYGLRDMDSWLRLPEQGGHASDNPLLFDDAGGPKPAAAAFVRAVRGNAPP